MTNTRTFWLDEYAHTHREGMMPQIKQLYISSCSHLSVNLSRSVHISVCSYLSCCAHLSSFISFILHPSRLVCLYLSLLISSELRLYMFKLVHIYVSILYCSYLSTLVCLYQSKFFPPIYLGVLKSISIYSYLFDLSVDLQVSDIKLLLGFIAYLGLAIRISTQSTGAVEYTDCTTVEE